MVEKGQERGELKEGKTINIWSKVNWKVVLYNRTGWT